MNKIDVVNRALRIPDVFSLQRPERGVTEISKELKLSKATAARLMYTLKECGYLTKSPATNKYRLGWKLAQLGGVYLASVPLREIALPRLKELNSKINETVDLYVVVGKQRLCIDRFESTYEVRPVAQAGKLAPLHAGASGKLLLAFMPEDKIQDFLETETLTRFTDHTITQKKDLLAEVGVIRNQGYATSMEERLPLVNAAAAPLRDYSGKTIAALGISGLVNRFTPQRMQSELIPAMLETAAQISRELGYLPASG